jgi:hypothetical protein
MKQTLKYVFVTLFFFVGLYACWPSKDEPKTTREKFEEAFSPVNGRHLKLTESVQMNLKDPSSFEHIQTVFYNNTNYYIVRMQYRAKNSFGGYIVNTATAKVDTLGNLIDYQL